MATSYNVSGYGYSQGLKLTEQQTNSFGGSLGKSLAGAGASPDGAAAGVGAVSRPITPSRVKPGSTSQSVDKSKTKSYYQGSLVFPSDIGKYYIAFKFKKYERKVADDQPSQGDKWMIYLPMPSNLQDTTSVTINETQLGMAGAGESIVMPALQTAASQISTGNFSAEAAYKAGEETAKNVLNLVSKEGAVYGLLNASKMLNIFSDAPSNLTELNFGQVPNPYQALMFKGVNLKSHTFSFRLTPRTISESNTIKEIIKTFKKSILPAKSNNGYLYGYPDICEVEFGGNKNNLYEIGPSFLESMSVNYAPTGAPAFFKTTGEPVEVDITLNLRELAPVLRGDIKK